MDVLDDILFMEHLFRLGNETDKNKQTVFDLFVKQDTNGKIIILLYLSFLMFILIELFNDFYFIKIFYKFIKLRFNISIKNVSKYKINDECPICKDILDIDKSIVKINCKCKYVYHRDCIIKWFNINSNCPFCRCKI